MHTFFVLLLLSLSVTGCATSVIPKPVSRLGPGVSQGTGFLIRSDGLVLTAYHVVDEGRIIKVRCQGYRRVPAKRSEPSRPRDGAPSGRLSGESARARREAAEPAAQAVCIVVAGP